MKLFSLEEANALLPLVRRLFAQIDRNRAFMRRCAPEIKLARHNADQNGGISQGSAYAEALLDFTAAIQTIHRLGIEVKDIDSGLIDFPHMRDGRVVYLCWKRGEDDIEWWHDIDAGFAGRQPL